MIQSLKKIRVLGALILCITATCYVACTKTDSKPPVTKTPVTITSINVDSGTYNTVVVITGTGFDATPANDKVFFNGKAATVSAATATQLTVAVPLDAGTGNITLSVNNAAQVSGPLFTYIKATTAATISSISLNSGPYNTTVIITGTGFDTTPANDKVFFNGKAATVSAATATQLTVAVPLGAGSGNITLSVNNAAAISGPVFTYQYSVTVSTFAGDGSQGFANGTGTSASFNYPYGIALDAAGNIYVADEGNSAIRKITPAGVVTTLAGNGTVGSADGAGTAASFFNPSGIAVDAAGNVFVADSYNNTIRKITTTGVVSTFAGKALNAGSTNGTGPAAFFSGPSTLVFDAAGNLFVADADNDLIRKITPAAVVTTFAGTGSDGGMNGTGTAASFHWPYGITIDATGNFYIVDTGNELIRKITPAGVVTTIAGNGKIGFTNGNAASASFSYPIGDAVDAAGNIYVADANNHSIRQISPTGVVTTLAGTGVRGFANGPGASAAFNNPTGVAVDAAGNVYVADPGNNLIRKITLQ
ncbi:MAG TPA: IPT/TIG domain-containing protein [Mucilaginibacter sp.]